MSDPERTELNHATEPMRVTLGEVYRAVMRVEARQKDHEEHHTSEGRWLMTTAVAIGGLVIALLQAVGDGPKLPS